MDIQGQAVLVTGGASGLGEATARELARLGAKVAVIDVNLELAEKVAAEIGGIACQCDITNTDSVQAALAKATAAHGPARILMNIAGIGTAKRIVGKDGNAAPLEDCARHQRQLAGRVQHQPLVCRRVRQIASRRRRPTRRDDVHGISRRIRRSSGPTSLQRIKRWLGQHDSAHGPRLGTARHSCVHHRSRLVCHTTDEDTA